MSQLRVLICDDEPLAVRRLSSMLSRIAGVEVVGVSCDGRAALEQLRALHVDLALLDVEMPEVDGFDIVEAMAASHGADREVPLVAFVTAFRRFAPQAFDSGALDFLSKPVRLPRLERTIDRAREALAGREARRRLIDLQGKLDSLRGTADPYREAHVWVPRRGENVRIDLEQVDRVAAEGAYVRLHVETASFLHREVISSIETKLNPSRFLRIHRSHIVRFDQISSIRRTLHGASELVLRDGHHVPVGRKYARDVRRRLFSKEPAAAL